MNGVAFATSQVCAVAAPGVTGAEKEGLTWENQCYGV
jgi:hypothetical protein